MEKRNNPIPETDEKFDQIGASKVSSNMRLNTRFHYIRMNPIDVDKMAFNTYHEQFEYFVLPVGACIASATF